MEEVRARAPGKIILSGEHAVVHGATAIAAAIDLYTHASFRLGPPDNGDGSVVLELKDSEMVCSWTSSRLKQVLGDPVVSSTPVSCSPERIKLIATLVEEQKIPEAKIWLSAGLSAFIHLYTSIHGYKPGKVVLSSDLPVGSGLGSSASFSVAVVATLLALSGFLVINEPKSGWLKLSTNELELVNKWAFEGEKIIHGKPSGIDNTVSTFGSMIQFRLGELTHIKSSVPLRMLITNTKVGRNTKALVAGVSERATRHQDAMAAVFSAIDFISKELSTIIESPAVDDISVTAREEKIEELMEMNQGLLQCMGVNHASIETVLRTTLKYKLVSKLTGAGGGGCVLTLLPKVLSKSVLDKVVAELESCGFQCLKTRVGGKGLEICFGEQSLSS
ncbi:mevalonate kinase-like [Canna indica]|uniref:Mevalonate kinase n=1 Tax=Canna indica TaxID=4628 RepID=A0AAQ3QRL8_9LILI|nr:mevalonate kinase-like [Canna indica]